MKIILRKLTINRKKGIDDCDIRIYTTCSSEKRNCNYRLGGRHGEDRDECKRNGEASGGKCLHGVSIDETARVSNTEDWKANRHSRRAVYGLDCEARR